MSDLKDILKESSIDFSQGVNETYDSDSTQQWNDGSQLLRPYSPQTNVYDSSTPTRMPDIAKEVSNHLVEKKLDIKDLLSKLQGTNTVEDLLKEYATDDIVIEIAELGNGAAAETLPDGKILVNDDIKHVDDLVASRLVHELVHFKKKKEQGYLEDPEELEAFQKQIQFLMEKDMSEEELKEHFLPLFEDYIPSEEAKELLNKLIGESKKELKAMTKTIKTATLQPLTFSPQDKVIIDRVAKAAKQLGISVFLAGGIVRDKLLGIENEDLDFVTNKDSEKLAALLASQYKLNQPVKMDRSGASMVVMDDRYLDIIDAAKVFSPIGAGSNESLEQGHESELSIFMDDAYRRDLTINSLMYGLNTGKLYDPTGKGYSDLENKVIRTIIDPYIKYRIHAPDMLRALRFYATKPGFKFAPHMLEAMQKNASKVAARDTGGDISARRIERELRKAGKDPITWQRMRGALSEVGLDKVIGKQIKDVDKDLQGNIKYDFSKEANLTTTEDKFVYQDIKSNLEKIAAIELMAADYAGRPLPDQPALPSTFNYPYLEDHGNYNAEQILKRKEQERKQDKLKSFVSKKKE